MDLNTFQFFHQRVKIEISYVKFRKLRSLAQENAVDHELKYFKGRSFCSYIPIPFNVGAANGDTGVI